MFHRGDFYGRLWEKDDATPGTKGHVTLEDAWLRLTGKPLDLEQATHKNDEGDAIYYTMPNGLLVRWSYPGNWAIYRKKG